MKTTKAKTKGKPAIPKAAEVSSPAFTPTDDDEMVDGVWPSEIKIGPHTWRVEPMVGDEYQVWPGERGMPLEDYILVDHLTHVIRLVGNHSPGGLGQILAALINGEGTTAAGRVGGGMKGITEIGGVVTPDGVYTAYLAKKLQCDYAALMLGNKIYFLESLTKERLVAEVLGFMTREIRDHVTGRSSKTFDWPDGLWFGKRQIHVELVKSGTEPCELLFDNDESTLLVLDTPGAAFTERHRITLIKRLFIAGGVAYKLWEQDAIKRQFRREQPCFSKPFIAGADSSSKKPRPKRRVRPGELLPASEREAMLQAGNDVLREMLADVKQPELQQPTEPPDKVE